MAPQTLSHWELFQMSPSGEQAQKHGKMYLLSGLMSKILQKKSVVFLIKSRDRDRWEESAVPGDHYNQNPGPVTTKETEECTLTILRERTTTRMMSGVKTSNYVMV